MYEYEELDDLDVPSQGDVIKWVGDAWSKPWQCFGVVVTADCDLALGKHGGVISYIPALTTEDFIWSRWRVDALGGKLDDVLSKVAGRISNWRAKNGQASAAPTASAMRRWLERTGAEGLLDEIGVTDKGQRQTLLNVIEPAATLLACMNCAEPDLHLLLSAYAEVNPKAAHNRMMMADAIQKSWASLPGDIFHLPNMPEGGARPGHGLFLHLRHIRQLDADMVSARPDAIRSGAAKAQRIARVSAPYRYAVTQALARVFSDIGLPDAHDGRRKVAAQSFFEPEVQS